MGILAADRRTPAPLTQQAVDAVMAEQKKHTAASTWDKFVKSLVANRFPFRITP